MSTPEIPPDAPVPRLCHLVKWSDFDGYGFNLHAEKSRSGQFIGKVDDDSPAQHAGLKEGDRIVEVNGVNIANENHRQVVERIKSIPNETKLLVVDEEADKWYKEQKLVVKSTQSNVRYKKTPVPRPPVDGVVVEPPNYENIAPVAPSHNGVSKVNSNASVGNGVKANGTMSSSSSSESPKLREVKANGTARHHEEEEEEEEEYEKEHEIKEKVITKVEVKKEQSPPVVNKVNSSPRSAVLSEEVNSRSSTPMDGSVPDSPHSTKSSRSSDGHSLGGHSNQNGPSAFSPEPSPGGLNLNMSASEMRQMLASRKKKDPKKAPMDIRQKYEIIQQM